MLRNCARLYVSSVLGQLDTSRNETHYVAYVYRVHTASQRARLHPNLQRTKVSTQCPRKLLAPKCGASGHTCTTLDTLDHYCVRYCVHT